jgi:hypothetical protein
MIYGTGSHHRLEPRDQVSPICSTTSGRGNQGLFLVTVLFLAMLSGCGSEQPSTLGPSGSAQVNLNITVPQKVTAVQNRKITFWATIRQWFLPTEAWALSAADVSTIQVQVTAPDLIPLITEKQVSNPQSGEIITLELDVPAGSNRTFTVTCLTRQRQSICHGRSDPHTLTAGQATTVDILLAESVPLVTSVSPANGATNVGIRSAIQITFSTPMAAATIGTQTVMVRVLDSTVFVPSSVTCNNPCTIATLTPSAPLTSGTSYTIMLGEGITDTEGNPLFFSPNGPGVSVPTTFTTGSIRGVGTVTGSVSRATDGQPIANSLVRIDSADIQDDTDQLGSFTLNNVPVGPQTVVATAVGFTTNSVPVTVREGQSSQVRISLNPAVSTDQISVILNWGVTPRDLDAHLLVPSPSPFEISFRNRGDLLTSPFAQLDYDHTAGFGPETITIAAPSSSPPPRFPGTYCYFVRNYLNDAALTSSGASVQVLNGNREIARFTIPTQGDGRVWEVFSLDGTTGAITTINRIADRACGPRE